eukprot:3670469-Prymnesium_polylepis.1
MATVRRGACPDDGRELGADPARELLHEPPLELSSDHMSLLSSSSGAAAAEPAAARPLAAG